MSMRLEGDCIAHPTVSSFRRANLILPDLLAGLAVYDLILSSYFFHFADFKWWLYIFYPPPPSSYTRCGGPLRPHVCAQFRAYLPGL